MSAQRHAPNGSTFTAIQVRAYDGAGALGREVRTQSNAPGFVGTTYYLTSSVLGGKIIEELTGSGQKRVGYVYATDGSLLATQFNGEVGWKHHSPTGTSELQTISNSSSFSRIEFDPLNANVSLMASETPPPVGGPGDTGPDIWEERYTRAMRTCSIRRAVVLRQESPPHAAMQWRQSMRVTFQTGTVDYSD